MSITKRDKIKPFYTEPQIKFNIKLNAGTDFIQAENLGYGNEFQGKYIKIFPIPKLEYLFFYTPPSIIEIYFLTVGGGVLKVPKNTYIPVHRVSNFIIVRPSNMTSGDMYFQYWLTNVEDLKVFDIYTLSEWDLSGSEVKYIYIPFPTYNMRVLFETYDLGSVSWNYQIYIKPYDSDHDLMLDVKLNITEKILNNFYYFSEVGGSGEVTNPHYIMPSFRTVIMIQEQSGTGQTNNLLTVMSWL